MLRNYISSEIVLISLISNKYNLYDCKEHGLYQIEVDSTDTTCNQCGKQGKLVRNLDKLRERFKMANIDKNSLEHILG